jgi:hypothetical protein
MLGEAFAHLLFAAVTTHRFSAPAKARPARSPIAWTADAADGKTRRERNIKHNQSVGGPQPTDCGNYIKIIFSGLMKV